MGKRLILKNVSKRFPFAPMEAVQSFNLETEPSEFLVLVGPSGCGKTTLLRMIAGLEFPTSGEVFLETRNITAVPVKDRNVAMVFQNPSLFPHLTLFENIAFGLMLRRTPKDEMAHRVSETAQLLGLAHLRNRYPNDLSGGEAQRVALGRALVSKPEIILFDEPLSQLDAPNRRQLRREILCLHERLGIPMIYVTHDQREALSLNKRIAIMKSGGLQQVGTRQQILDNPETGFVTEFFNEAV